MTSALALPTKTGVAHAPGTPEFEATACYMAREFSEATAEIVRLGKALKAQTDRLQAAFTIDGEEPSWRNSFGIDLSHNGERYIRPDQLDKILTHFTRRAWGILADHLGIKAIMSVADREKFDKQLESGDMPPITEDTIVSVLMGLAGQAQDFAAKAVREVFDLLRPTGKWWGAQYKTNSPFRVGRKVILVWYVSPAWSGQGFRESHNHEKHLTAIDGVFHLLDGKGPVRDHPGPLIQAIRQCGPSGRGETEYFRFRCFKNQNLHLEFKRLDLVKQLNGVATGEYVLGADPD